MLVPHTSVESKVCVKIVSVIQWLHVYFKSEHVSLLRLD